MNRGESLRDGLVAYNCSGSHLGGGTTEEEITRGERTDLRGDVQVTPCGVSEELTPRSAEAVEVVVRAAWNRLGKKAPQE